MKPEHWWCHRPFEISSSYDSHSGVEYFFSLSSFSPRSHTAMDPPLTPPLRIQVTSTAPISTEVTGERIARFLPDFQARSTSAQGGNTAVMVQLQKLMDALKEERAEKKKHKKNRKKTEVQGVLVF